MDRHLAYGKALPDALGKDVGLKVEAGGIYLNMLGHIAPESPEACAQVAYSGAVKHVRQAGQHEISKEVRGSNSTLVDPAREPGPHDHVIVLQGFQERWYVLGRICVIAVHHYEVVCPDFFKGCLDGHAFAYAVIHNDAGPGVPGQLYGVVRGPAIDDDHVRSIAGF